MARVRVVLNLERDMGLNALARNNRLMFRGTVMFVIRSPDCPPIELRSLAV